MSKRRPRPTGATLYTSHLGKSEEFGTLAPAALRWRVLSDRWTEDIRFWDATRYNTPISYHNLERIRARCHFVWDGGSDKMAVVTKQDYEALAGFRLAIRRFFRFSEEAARAAGLTPQQHQLLLALKGYPGRD